MSYIGSDKLRYDRSIEYSIILLSSQRYKIKNDSSLAIKL